MLSGQLIVKFQGFDNNKGELGASIVNNPRHFSVYTTTPWGKSRIHRTNAPDSQELMELMHTISHRVAGFLVRDGILERDEENSYLNLEGDEEPLQQVLSCSVSYRIAIGAHQGRKVFTLQTIPAWEDDDRFAQVAQESGFSLHAGVAVQTREGQPFSIEIGQNTRTVPPGHDRFFAPAKPAYRPSMDITWAQRLKRVFTKSRRFRRHRCFGVPDVRR
jgi:hypothetical protein